jgi:hypothetical protein
MWPEVQGKKQKKEIVQCPRKKVLVGPKIMNGSNVKGDPQDMSDVWR